MIQAPAQEIPAQVQVIQVPAPVIPVQVPVIQAPEIQVLLKAEMQKIQVTK